MQFHVEVPALAGLDAVSAILCPACLVPAHLNCSWCRFLLWVWFGPWGMSSICCCFCCFFCEGLLMQFHVEVPALAVWMLFLQFYVLLVLFLDILIAVGAGSCFGSRSGLEVQV